MHFRTASLVALLAALTGCGGGDICSRPSPCPNDVMATPTQMADCRASLDANKSAACYREAYAWTDCIFANRVCSAGGTTDGALSSTKASNNCRNQQDAVISCCNGNPTSTVCN